ncbi:helix-turn-helix domain-containing protein [Paractinoplanes globisporus]|uniref:Helix-turn-helix domain-containing protein n=1 Tax=Paractinoplanes globisporus TaxID=113565 RepID=A0ABW6WH52_9ACTN|nr:helix-turn-helix transcriptional regulator [Actinoplanes globisporus]
MSSATSRTRDNLAQVIRADRLRRGLTQQQFAALIGVSQPEVARWESGRIREISVHTRELLADAGIDRALLGIHGYSFEKISADLQAVREITNKVGNLRLALAVLDPPLAWLESRWHSSAYQAGQAETELMAGMSLAKAVILTLISIDTNTATPFLELAEFAYHRIHDDVRRWDGLSETLILGGNQNRKRGRLEDAAGDLAKAAEFAGQANFNVRQAEALGLQAYVRAELGDRRTCLRIIEAGQVAFDRPTDARSSTNAGGFNLASFEEIRLRCELLAGSTADCVRAARQVMLPNGMTSPWQIFYANTAGGLLARIRDPGCLHWFELALNAAIAHSLPEQLMRTAHFLAAVPGRESEQLTERANLAFDEMTKG